MYCLLHPVQEKYCDEKTRTGDATEYVGYQAHGRVLSVSVPKDYCKVRQVVAFANRPGLDGLAPVENAPSLIPGQ